MFNRKYNSSLDTSSGSVRIPLIGSFCPRFSLICPLPNESVQGSRRESTFLSLHFFGLVSNPARIGWRLRMRTDAFYLALVWSAAVTLSSAYDINTWRACDLPESFLHAQLSKSLVDSLYTF